MKDISFCLMTCGEETEQECLQAIQSFRNDITFIEVRNVRPQVKALNQMIQQATTPYLVPLDADIILNPDALNRLQQAIVNFSYDASWHTILFPLFDTLTEQRILALKLFRTEIIKKNPFRDVPTPDVEHYQRLKELGYKCIDYYLPTIPIGNHVVRGPKFSYHKYRDVYQTLRTYDREWDPGVFLGGTTLKEKSKKHFDYFLYKFVMTKNRDYLYCIAGMLHGICGSLGNGSKSIEEGFEVDITPILDEYWGWYARN